MDRERVTEPVSDHEFGTMKIPPLTEDAAAGACPPDDSWASAPITERPPGACIAAVVTPPDRATLLALAGIGAGETHTLEHDATIVGRDEMSTLVIDDPSVSRHHARITREADGAHWIEDLASTNGTFVNGRRIQRALLSTGDRVQIGRDSVFRFALVDEREEALQRQLYDAARRDALTALANRRCLFDQLRAEIWHARRERRRLAFLAMDVDHFKSVNDRFGHLAGDQVLRAIALTGARTLRGGDLFARYGGEELAVIARDAGRVEATTLAERLRWAISEMRVEVGSGAIAVTVSIGLAVLAECEDADEGMALFARADACLYAAKRAGRNRVCAIAP